jgi:AcrR family transcriptional regulator
MDRMAAEAGVTKPILYRHFQDRAGLVAAIGECAFNQVSVELDKALHADVTPRQMVLSTIDTYLQFIESDPDVYRFLVHRTSNEGTGSGPMLNEYMARAGCQVAMVLGEGLRAAGLDSGPAEAWAFGIVGMVHSAGDWWMDRATMPRVRLAEYLTNLVYDGLSNAESLGTAGTSLPAAGGDAPGTVLPPDSSTMTHTTADIEPDSAERVVNPVAPKRRRSS